MHKYSNIEKKINKRFFFNEFRIKSKKSINIHLMFSSCLMPIMTSALYKINFTFLMKLHHYIVLLVWSGCIFLHISFEFHTSHIHYKTMVFLYYILYD